MAAVKLVGQLARLVWLEITWQRVVYAGLTVVHVIKRTIEGVLLGGILLASATLTYQNYSQMVDAPEMPGQHLSRNPWGQTSHMLCKGVAPTDARHPRPVVILEAMEMLGQALVWKQLQERLATHGIVCSYDRAGFGWSAWGTSNRSPKVVAAELAYMLVNGSNGAPPSVELDGNRVPIQPPFVLAGHSAGSIYSRQFAMDFPNLTAAIVAFDGLPVFGAGFAGADAYASDMQQYLTRDVLWATNAFLQPLGVVRALFPLIQVRLEAARLAPAPRRFPQADSPADGLNHCALCTSPFLALIAFVECDCPPARVVMASSGACHQSTPVPTATRKWCARCSA